MIITIHQPEHMPWLGLINKASMADVFVLLDTVQFRKNYFQNRNKILSSNGPVWITVPVKKYSLDTLIKDVEINNSLACEKKYLKTIYFNYVKSSYFKDYMPEIEEIFSTRYHLISQLNIRIILWLFEKYNINSRLVESSALPESKEKRDGLLLDICRELGASTYISGISGKEYLDENPFKENKIHVEYQEFYHPVYSQMHDPFVHCMSAIDLLFNHGAKSRDILLNSDSPKLDYLIN